MIVTTITKERIRSISLPAKPAGQYWLYGQTEENSDRLVSVEGINEEWILKAARHVRVFDRNGTESRSMPLEPLQIYTITKDGSDPTIVFTEPATDDRQIFRKYIVRHDLDLYIGRAQGNDIHFENTSVSSLHATVFFRGGKWFIQDEKSTNGTFVNEMRVERAGLKIGDCIFVMGLKIVLGKNFIAVNNPDGKVSVSGKLIPYEPQIPDPVSEEDEYELAPQEYFYRSPRFKRDIETAEFRIDSPPASPVSEEMPFLLMMGSSLAMGMMSIVTLSSAIITNNIMSMVMGGSMLVGTLLMPTITKRYERRRARKKEALRQKKYREYLDDINVKINEESHQQAEILNENYVTVAECETRILEEQRNLWERGAGQNDFLRVRLGTGEGQLDAHLSYQERRFSINSDNLEEELYSLAESPKVLHNIPITYSLFENQVSGVIGSRRQVADFAKGMIIQLAALYSYDEVKFVFLFDPEEMRDFGFVKWLPHVWSDDYKFRFVATDQGEVKEISAYLENEIAARIAMNEKDLEDVSPYYIFFSMSRSLASRADMIKQVLKKKENIRMSVVTFYDELRNLPKECSMVVELDGLSGRLFDKNDISGQSTAFTPDIYPTRDPLILSTKLANIQLDTLGNNFQLPGLVTFLEMYGVGKVEHLNALSRWKENDPTKSLEAPVGIDTLGEIFKLDLHEKFHGPHGLVAGMTGSGKSEFIITYILSLAVNYHPNEVAFILIDYKGGGMAKSFENLPHTAGIITNLDGAAIKRSLVSIESELKRRQAIFAQASKQVGVSNIDIYKYQKLYREGTVSEPLQHLFIISDEFAELKTQQPEFMTQLVSAARIGRSLGVHLILATQKPSGVVDDQIWSNSKFRVCLKVQERADSMDMLKRADAAELTETGRFYLQVGYNELFELGQSAWAGATYYPSDRVEKERDDSVAVIDRNGHTIREVKIDHRRQQFQDERKQLDVITEYLRNIADEENIHIRPLWLEPIPSVILVDEIRAKYSAVSERFLLNPVIGEYDDPARQRQDILRLPISEEGNAVIYGVAGGGKTSFLNAMIYSLLHEHTPEEVNLYLLDFASETLRAFAKAPHVGDVIFSYEEEKISNLFKMLQKETEIRKRLFADYGGDYQAYIRSSGKTLPSIVVVIHNFAAFAETYEEKEEAVSYLSREGTKYGIYFILTSVGTGGVRFRLLQNFKQLVCLQLNDEADYAGVIGKTDGLIPSRFKGRGLIRRDELYEFQTAMLTRDEVPYGFISEDCMKLASQYHGTGARKIPILPDQVDLFFLRDYVRPGERLSVPIGVENSSLNVHYYPFGDSYLTMILSAGNDYQRFLGDLAALIGGESGAQGWVFDLTRNSIGNLGAMRLAATARECEQEIAELFSLVLYRNNTFKDAAENGTPCEEFEQKVVIINSLSALRAALSEEGAEKLSLILEKGSVEYKINILIGEQSKTASTVTFERWYKANVSQTDGIWIGGGIAEQYQLKASRTTAEMHDDLTSQFGFAIENGKAVKVKLLNDRSEEPEDDE